MRRALSLVAALTLALSLGACGGNPRPRSATVFAMDTVMELTVYGDKELLDEAEGILRRMEKSLSVTDPESEIHSLNETGNARLSADAVTLLRSALSLGELTGGALDITVYPLVRAWGFTTGDYRVPGEDEITALLQRVGYAAVTLDLESVGADGGLDVSLPEGVMVDLGSVAKGLASDYIADAWISGGAGSGLINLGGNVYALGRKPDGALWRIGVRDPFGETYLGVLEVEDRAVVTSGGYQRYFEEGGRTYCHIIDPRTGHPADSGLASVTVIGREGLLCDGLSTAIFVMGLDAAARLWRERDDFDLVLVTDGGGVYITEGIEDCFTLAGNYLNADLQVIRRG